MKRIVATLGAAALLAPLLAARQGGAVLWTVRTDDTSPGYRARTAADGRIYWNPGHSLHALSPAGEILRSVAAGELTQSNPIDLGADGTVYAGDGTFVYAFTPDLELVWRFDHEALGFDQGLIGGPTVGLDGNVYAVGDSGPFEPGLFSLTTTGDLRWTLPGFGSNGGSPPAVIPSGAPGHVYVAANSAPTGAALRQGLFGVGLDGQVQWIHVTPVGPGDDPGHEPVVSPRNGNVHVTELQGGQITTFSPHGDLLWTFAPAFQDGDLRRPPVVDNEGSVLFVTDKRRAFRLSPDGDVLWQTGDLLGVPAFPSYVQLSPDEGRLLVGFGGVVPAVVLALDTADGKVLWTSALPIDDSHAVVPHNFAFSPDGRRAYVNASTPDHAFLIALSVSAREGTIVDAGDRDRPRRR